MRITKSNNIHKCNNYFIYVYIYLYILLFVHILVQKKMSLFVYYFRLEIYPILYVTLFIYTVSIPYIK